MDNKNKSSVLPEIIDDLNIPKQVIDKTEAFMKAIFGASVIEMSELFADKIRFRRLKNQIKIFEQANELIEKNNLQISELGLKTLVPLIEKSSLEDDEFLQEKWSKLLANMATSSESGLESKLVSTLSSLSSIEARILDFCYEYTINARKKRFERAKNNKYNRYNSIDDIKLERIRILKKWIENQFSIKKPYSSIYIENIESLNLIKYDDPDISVSDSFSEAKGLLNKDNKVGIDLELDLDVDYSPSDDFKLTSYGIYFIRKCSSINQ